VLAIGHKYQGFVKLNYILALLNGFEFLKDIAALSRSFISLTFVKFVVLVI
jgi:hypothetical protein